MLKPRQPVRLDDADVAKRDHVVPPPGTLFLKPVEQTHFLPNVRVAW